MTGKRKADMAHSKTGFYFDERCMWHTAAAHALIVPVGGWVEPLAAGGHAESPESKRRFKSLLDVSGLTAQLDVRSAPAATMDDLLRVHGRAYLDEFKKLQNAIDKKITIYLVSSSFDDRDITRSKDYAEVTDYIIKPVNRANLVNVLKEIDL